MRPSALLFAAAAAFLFGGCAGYHVGPVVPKKMEGVKSVAVPSFENGTLIPRLEVLAAGTVIKQIQQDGTFQVANSGNADVILEGKVLDVKRRGARSVRGDVLASREYTLTVDLQYTLVNRVTGEQLDRGKVRGESSFFVSGNDVNQDERQAIPLAIEDAAVRLVSLITEGW